MILRNPEFGNSFTVDTNTEIRRSVEGSLIVTRSSNWPITESFTVTIRALNLQQRDLLKSFYRNTAGQEIQLVDHENRTWNGMIVTNNPKITTNEDGCNYESSFTFEGAPE
jgi:hypothetical protein